MSQSSQHGSLSELKRWTWFRLLCLTVLVTFCADFVGIDFIRVREAQAQSIVMAPQPGTLLSVSPATVLPSLKAISIDPADPLKINFLVDAGDHLKVDQEESRPLIKYFLTFLTMPEEDLWVNLSPSEPGRIVNPALGATSVGRDMLMEDYLLKQLAASMTFPEREPGKTFWEQIYLKIKKQYGDVDLPLNTFSKVWIVPEKAVVYEQKDAAVISESRLKVMLDEDYLTMKKASVADKTVNNTMDQASELYLKIAREIIIPELEREVNEGQYFAPLRQMFNSLVLAIWFKRKLHDHVLNQIYTNQKKTSGVQIEDKKIGQKIYEQYMLALQKGVYNVIREESDPLNQEVVPRHYFSGGVVWAESAMVIEYKPMPSLVRAKEALITLFGLSKNFYRCAISLLSRGMSRKTLLNLSLAAGILTGAHLYASTPAPYSSDYAPRVAQSAAGPGNVVSAEQAAPPKIYEVEPQSIELEQPASVSPSIHEGQVISAEAAVVPEEIGLLAHTSGIVSGFDPTKTFYEKKEGDQFGEVMFRIVNPDVMEQVSTLTQKLSTEQSTLDGLLSVAAKNPAAAASLEISEAQERVSSVSQALARLNKENQGQEVRAPCRLTIKNSLVSNGMTVNHGAKVLDYFTAERVRVTLEMPLTQTYFGRIGHFKIGGKDVKRVVSVDWRLNPQRTGAVVTFLVTPGDGIPTSGKAHVEIEMLPPAQVQAGLEIVHGQAETLAAVHHVIDREILAPAVGPAEVYVKEGDQVKAGQLLADQMGSATSEYNETLNALQSVEDQLKQSEPVNGVYFVNRSVLDGLKEKKAALVASLENLKGQSGRLAITAPVSGTVMDISSLRSSSLRTGDKMIRLRTSGVVIGDVNDMNAAILLPQSLDIQINDPVLLRTPSGDSIPARVSNINRMPKSSTVNLGPVQAVEFMAIDVNNVLWPNLPLKVIVPAKGGEKDLVEKEQQRLERLENESHAALAQDGSLTPASLIQPAGVVMQPASQIISQAGSHDLTQPLISASTNGQPISIADLASRVMGNELLNGEQRADVAILKLEEGFPKAWKLSLDGLVTCDSSGKVLYGGGLNAAFQGIMANVGAGSAYSPYAAAIPIVASLSGQLVEQIEGVPAKKQALAAKRTEIEFYGLQNTVAQRVNEATDHFIDSGNAQMHIDQLKTLVADLQNGLDAITDRENAGLSRTRDLLALQEKLDEAKALLAKRQQDQKKGITDLNDMMRSSLEIGISPSLPWNGKFSGISAERKQAFFDLLEKKDSQNYRLKGARVAQQAVDDTIKLQNVGDLGSFNVGGFFSTEDPSSAKVDPPGAPTRTSLLTTKDGALKISLPLIDKHRKIEKAIAVQDRLKARIHVEKTDSEEHKKLTEILSDLDSLSQQIEQADIAYDHANQAWQNKPSWLLTQEPKEWGALLAQKTAAAQEWFDLRAKYFKAEARLRAMQLLDSSETLVGAKEQPASNITQAGTAAVVNAVSPERSARFEPLPDLPAGWYVTVPVQGLSAGFVNYPSDSVTGLWPLMTGGEQSSQDQLDVTLRILTQDPNIMTRTKTLDFFLEELQSNRKALGTAEQIVLNSPYSDVVQKLLPFMANMDGCDVRFLVYTFDQAIQKNNSALAALSLQVLDDILIQDGSVLQRLKELNFVPGTTAAHNRISAEMERKALLTFLSSAPDDSIAKIRLLQSEYWTTDQLVEICSKLRSSKDTVSQNLGQLIYDEILRREVLDDLDEFFNKGAFKILPSYFSDDDIYAAFMYDQLRDMNRKFLTTSPQWRDMKGHIPEKLYAGAKASTDSRLAAFQGSSSEGPDSLVYDFSNTSMPDTSLLAYFDSLSFDAQKAYIKNAKSLPELARIFKSRADLRGMALARLMETPAGRVLVLKAYTGSDDNKLCELVEGREWIDLLSEDVPAIGDSVSNDILRRAMEKMFQRTHEEWPLNFRLKTYGFSELHMATDPRGDGQRKQQMNALATELALGLVTEDRNHSSRWVAGRFVYTTEELRLMSEIKSRLFAGNDPKQVESFLNGDARRNPATQRILKDLFGWKDRVTKAIEKNNQTLPFMPSVAIYSLRGVVALVLYYIGKLFLRGLFLKKAETPTLISELRREGMSQTEDLESAMANGNGQSWKERVFPWLFKSRSKDKVPTVVNIPEEDLYRETGTFLKTWRDVVRQWAGNGHGSTPEDMINDLNNILNNASEVLRKIPYSPELMGKPNAYGAILNEQYHRTLNYFNLLSIDTLHVMEDVLKKRNDLDDRQKKTVLRDIQRLVKMTRYGTRYMRILRYRAIIDRVMGYKFSDRDWREKSKIYPFIRVCLLYDYLLTQSKKGIDKELKKLLEDPEDFLPGLYGSQRNKNDIVQKSNEILTEAVREASNLISPLGARDADRMKGRSFISRVFLLGAPLILGATFAATFFGIGSPLVATVSLLSLLGMLVRIAIFWKTHFEVMQMSWSKIMDLATERLNLSLSEKLSTPSDETTEAGDGDAQVKIARLAVQDGAERLKKEMDPANRPSVDMIMIIPQDKPSEDNLKNYVRERRGTLFREGAPVEVRPATLKGSANVFFEAMQFVRNRLKDENFLRENPHLRGVPWQDVRVMYVLHGKKERQSEGILDWAVINGYRVAGAMREAQAGGEDSSRGATSDEDMVQQGSVIIYSRDVYLGPMLKFPRKDINLLGEWANKKELKSLGLMIMDFVRDGINVREILEKLDINELKKNDHNKTYRNKILQHLDEHYDLTNDSLRQFPGLTGIMGLSSRTMGVLGKVLDGLEKNPKLWARLEYLHMTEDIFNNLLKPRDEVAGEYLDNRINFSDIQRQYGIYDRDEARRLFRPLYKMFLEIRRDMGEDLSANTVLPHSGSAEVVYIQDQQDMEKAKELLKQGGLDKVLAPRLVQRSAQPKILLRRPVPQTSELKVLLRRPTQQQISAMASPLGQNNSQVPDKNGGLDFSGIKDNIEFKAGQVPSAKDLRPAYAGRPIQFLQLFRGFDFQINTFQPLEDPGMFLSF